MTDLDLPGYRIKRTLGRGGMATVYLAEQLKFERDVALKVMAPALSADEGFRERFLREAKIVARISHPNIVAVYDVNEVNGVYYIAMEFHPGGDLKARIRGGLTVAEALRIARDVARALDYAHAKGYLHRDIKPDNILFREDGSAVLTDFGIAKATEGDAGLTQMGMVAGTPKYMSPEQARAQALDADSDLYSLGVVLFEMLTGHLPFEATDPIALGIMHMNAPVPRLEGALAHFQPLLDRLLAKQPGQRPQSGAQVIREIDALEKTFDFSAPGATPADSETALRPAVRRPAAPAAAPAPAASAPPRPAAPSGGATPAMAGGEDATVLAPAALAPVAPRAAAPAPVPATPAAPAPAPSARGKVAAAVALVVALAGGGGWWAQRHSEASAQAARVSAELDAGAAALARNALVAPPPDNALAHYRAALLLQPGNADATAGIGKVVAALQAQAYAALAEKRFDAADRLLAQASEIDPSDSGHVALQRAIAEARVAASREEMARGQEQTVAQQVAVRQERRAEARAAVREQLQEATPPDALARLRIGGMLGSARRALEDGDTATAIQRYEQVLRLDPANREAREGLRLARAR
ncbi:MAG TPA: serine/threonine-protein kinase [Moraxellaceae bacterium]|nr:serine/threonine-protein kinase [Moraxellaceae bacterium]